MSRRSAAAIVRSVSPWAKRIRDLRIDRDLSQAFIADLLHVSQRVYADYELGNVRVPVDHLIRLAYYYNVDLNYICSAEHEPKPFPDISHNCDLYALLVTIDNETSI